LSQVDRTIDLQLMNNKRFIISLNNTTRQQQKEFADYLTRTGVGFWHWLENTWLIVDRNNVFTAEQLREILDLFFPKVHNLVIQLNHYNDTWAGFGPSGDNKNMFNWLNTTWKENNNNLL